MRPSGKITSGLPALTALMSVRVAIGLVGSSGMARVKRRNGFTHQCCAIALSMANTGSFGEQRQRQRGVEEADV